MIAHRGASAYAPENTIVAFKKARLLGATMIEFDVKLSKDRIPVVIHDDNIKRTTNGKGIVSDFTVEQLQSFDAGKWFARKYKGQVIPTLEEVIELMCHLDIFANVEIKPFKGEEAETVAQTLSCLNQYWPIDKPPLLISSFEYSVLEMVRSFSPDQPLGFLMHHWDPDWAQKASNLNCFSIHTYHRILNQKRVDEIKEKQYQLLTYTVNRSRRANKLLAMGVDGIFSDYPDLLK